MWYVNEKDLLGFVILGSAIGMISLIITKTYITEKFRIAIIKRNQFWGRWINCPICFGTWVTFVGMLLHGKIIKTQFWGLDWLITWFALDFIACLCSGILYRLFKSEE